MDTQNPSTADVPTFKLAKVGKDRKRGGAAWFGGGRGAGSGLRLLSGGAGSGTIGSKILMICMVSSVASFGAHQLGAVLRGAPVSSASDGKKAFAPKAEGPQHYDDLSGVIKGENTIPNSLGYVSGSVDGLTPEERAKKAADEAAARKAAEEAQKKADAEEAAKQASMPSAMPADVANLMAQKSGKPGLKNFNKLSSSFGGAAGGSKLSGGPGLSGGVARGFVAPTGPKGQSGAMASFKGGSNASISKAARAASVPSRSRSFAKRQLLNANGLSRQAVGAGKAESSAEAAGQAFNGGTAGGTSIEGGGASGGSSDWRTPKSMTTDDGGAVGAGGAGTPDCGANQHVGSDGTSCVANDPPKTENACKYQGLLDAVTVMLALVAVISLLEKYYLAAMASGVGVATLTMYHACVYAIMGLGAAVCAIGIQIATMSGGDFMIGAIIGVVGGFIAYTAYMGIPAVTSTINVAHILIASAMGMLTSAMSGGPKND